MRVIQTIAITGAIVAGVTSFALLSMPRIAAQPVPPASAGELRPAASFAGIADARARAVALFQEAGKVLQHPRCVNCHPRGDSPRQTDRMRPHQPLVVRDRRAWRVDTSLQHMSWVGEFRSRARHGTSRMAPGAGVDGLGRPLARANLRADQRPRAQWGSQHGGPPASP